MEPAAGIGRFNSRQANRDMIWIPGGTFRMGSDRHYPEEAPAHRVTVDGFWIDRTPVTNRQFKEFVRATNHVTFAGLPPDPSHYPGMLPHFPSSDSLRLIRHFENEGSGSSGVRV